jgi:hypothetical protein
MTASRSYLLCAILLLSAGCSPAPVVVTAPDAATLQPLVGKEVILEGQVTLTKAGLVLRTSGLPIILEYLGAQDATWPEPGIRVQVTGVLRKYEVEHTEYRFRLERPQSTIIENQAR